jgi:hypothetical protein
MRIKSRRWQASILLVLAIVIGTSALSSLQHRPSLQLNGSAGSSFEFTATQISGAATERSISALPETHDWFAAADHHFDVEGSRSDRHLSGAGIGLTLPTDQLGANIFSGIEPTRRVAHAAHLLSLSARARN